MSHKGSITEAGSTASQNSDNMKDHLVTIFIVLLLGLTSCGMQKRIMSQDMQADVTTVTEDRTDLSREIEGIVREQLEQMLDIKAENTLLIERKVWSPPDTAGNQYIVSEERVTSETRVTETTTSIHSEVGHVTGKTDSTSVSASVEDLGLDKEMRATEKDGLPWWQMTLMAVGAAVLLLLIIKIALRYI